MGLGTVIAASLRSIRRSDDSVIVPAMGDEAASPEERMKKGQAALEHAPDDHVRDLLTMYRGWGSGAADYVFEKLDPATLSPEQVEAKKKSVLGVVHHSITKLSGLSDAQQRELDELAAIVVDTAFEARLAERMARPEV